MQTNKEAEQVTLSDLGICCGKMFQELSPAEHPKARTSVSSSKRSSELSAVPFMSLDLTPGHGNLLGESYWELISPWLGGAWMESVKWILCPICKNKTRIKVRRDTILHNFPLFCPKCKQETLINVKQLNMSVIKEPDAKTQSR